jgi:PhnB protein
MRAHAKKEQATMPVPYLVVDRAAEAIEFYKRAFGFLETLRMPGPDGKVMHAALDLPGGGEHGGIYLADEFPMSGACKSPKSLGGTTVTLHFVSVDVDAAFDRAVKAGATPLMPPTDMFWGDRYCKIADPFGHHWSIATHKEELSEEEMKRRGQDAMKHFKASQYSVAPPRRRPAPGAPPMPPPATGWGSRPRLRR